MLAIRPREDTEIARFFNEACHRYYYFPSTGNEIYPKEFCRLQIIDGHQLAVEIQEGKGPERPLDLFSEDNNDHSYLVDLSDLDNLVAVSVTTQFGFLRIRCKTGKCIEVVGRDGPIRNEYSVDKLDIPVTAPTSKKELAAEALGQIIAPSTPNIRECESDELCDR